MASTARSFRTSGSSTTEIYEMPDDLRWREREAEEGTLNTMTFTEEDGRTTLMTTVECHTQARSAT